MKRILSILFVVGFVALVFSLGAVRAADVYPSRTIQMIVPFPPGGVADRGPVLFLGSGKGAKTTRGGGQQDRSGRRGGHAIRSRGEAGRDTLMVALSSISVMPEVDALFGRPSTYNWRTSSPSPF